MREGRGVRSEGEGATLQYICPAHFLTYPLTPHASHESEMPISNDK